MGEARRRGTFEERKALALVTKSENKKKQKKRKLTMQEYQNALMKLLYS